MDAVAAYVGLFAAAFLAATIFPAQSEAALLGLLTLDRYPTTNLLGVASIGNILGSSLNYGLGRFLSESEYIKRLMSSSHGELTMRWYRRYGKWTLLASWVPVIGDPLTVVAGMLREKLATFLIFVTVAKVGRYLALIALHQAWLG